MKMDWTLPLLAGLLVLVGTAIGLYMTYSFRTQSNNKQETIEQLNREISIIGNNNQNLNKQIIELSSNLKQISDETKSISKQTKDLVTNNQKLTSKNIELTNKTLELSDVIKNIQTGGNSYCTFEIFYSGKGKDITPEMSIIHSGDFVMRSVKITIEDYYRRGQYMKNTPREKMNFDDIVSSDIRINIGTLIPESIVNLGDYILMSEQDEINLTIRISSENGHFYQRLKHIDIKNNRKSALILKGNDSNILYENIHSDFPRNKDGSVNWKN